MRTITVEEHFATPGFLDGPGLEIKNATGRFAGRGKRLAEALLDLGDKRLAAMDEAGIDVQVVSLTSPGAEMSDPADAIVLAREANDYAAEAIKKHPTRFAAFAAVPTSSPDKAAQELETRVKQGGFRGVIFNGHTRGRYLDDKFFWPILECAENLDVPMHIHPALPPKAVIDVSFAGFSPEVSGTFAGSAWGWHIETAIHVVRLILGGAFDRFPKLQIVIGHLGEALTFMLPRLDVLTPAMTKLKYPVSHYLRHNAHYSISGFNYPAAFLDLLLEIGVERIMFSADHPFQSMPKARAFLEQLPVSTADRERIAHGNAEKLFKL
jgi:uncharacterized protein